jgi:AraC-like DNA-binding protein
MKANIKNMMCDQCRIILQMELKKIGLHYGESKKGDKEIIEDVSELNEHDLSRVMKNCGFELVRDKRSAIIEKLKNIIIELVYDSDNDDKLKINLSRYISDKMNYDYTYLSNIFSGRQGISIERYYITQKIERVKSLLLFDQFNLTEIAYMLKYSSVAHLSGQFKKITGLTPSQFKELKSKERVILKGEKRNEAESHRLPNFVRLEMINK